MLDGVLGMQSKGNAMDKMPRLEMDQEGGDLVSQLKLNYTQW